MRPLKLMWNVGVKYPAKATGALAIYLAKKEISGWHREKLTREIADEHDAAGQIADSPPPPLQSAVHPPYTVVDMPGSVLTFVDSTHEHWIQELENLPLGLALVTLRRQPGPKGNKLKAPMMVGAYVNGRQVGWWNEIGEAYLLPDVDWVKSYNKKGILPRFRGKVVEFDGKRQVLFLIPHFLKDPAGIPGPRQDKRERPAGWYPDPAGVPGYRFWDGSQWTDDYKSSD
jgi:hypothetical protein